MSKPSPRFWKCQEGALEIASPVTQFCQYLYVDNPSGFTRVCIFHLISHATPVLIVSEVKLGLHQIFSLSRSERKNLGRVLYIGINCFNRKRFRLTQLTFSNGTLPTMFGRNAVTPGNSHYQTLPRNLSAVDPQGKHGGCSPCSCCCLICSLGRFRRRCRFYAS